jgi:hypothetical protein
MRLPDDGTGALEPITKRGKGVYRQSHKRRTDLNELPDVAGLPRFVMGSISVSTIGPKSVVAASTVCDAGPFD